MYISFITSLSFTVFALKADFVYHICMFYMHRLRPIDTQLALYTMLYNNSAKNRYAEPGYNKTMKIFKIRD